MSNSPVPIPQDPGIAPGGGQQNSALQQQLLQQFLQYVQGKKAGQAVPGGAPVVQSPGGAPAVGNIQPGMGTPGQSPQVGVGASGSVKLQPSYQPRQPAGPIQTEFSTPQGRDAAGLAAIANQLQGAVGRYEQKKAAEKANKAETGVMLWYQAVANKDYDSANAILEQYGDSISKAFGKGILPQYGQGGQKPSAEAKQPKPQKPSPEQGGLVSALNKIKQKMLGPPQGNQQPQLPLPKASVPEQIQGTIANATLGQLQKPGVADTVAGAGLGLNQLPADIQKQQAAYEAEYRKVTAQVMGDLAKAQAEIEGKMNVTLKEIAGRKDVAVTETGGRIKSAEIEAGARIKAAMIHAQASLKAGKVADAVNGLNTTAGEFIKAYNATGDKDGKGKDQKYLDLAMKMLEMAGTVGQAKAYVQNDQMMNQMLPQNSSVPSK